MLEYILQNLEKLSEDQLDVIIGILKGNIRYPEEQIQYTLQSGQADQD